jgi:succinyl-diaminopimelate desuccinylase
VSFLAKEEWAMKDKAFAFIENSADEIVGLESLLTSIPAIAPEAGGDGELKKAEALVEWLVRKGMSLIERYDAPDPRASGGKRPNIVVTIPGEKDEGRLLIMTHLDVVPAGDPAEWITDPFTMVRKGDVIFGRGVEDNQQGVVSAIFAALSLIENNIIPPRTVKLLFVADEEVGSKKVSSTSLHPTILFEKAISS